MKLTPFFLGTILALLISCSKQADTFGRLDLVKWRADRSGCTGERAGQLNNFKEIEADLLSKSSNEIADLLGKPDIQQLAERNQKYYIYFVEKGTQCDDIKNPSAAMKVVLRINAVGLVSEITYQRELV